jgi:single-strand DNA-binding protein
MVNKVTLIGYLGADPEVRRIENGAAVARIRLATSESYKDNAGTWQNRSEWHTVIAWRELAERSEATLKKGSLIYVEGKLATRDWTDKNGTKRSSTEVVASYIKPLSAKEGSGVRSFPTADNDPQQFRESGPTTENSASMSSSGAEDDLPF